MKIFLRIEEGGGKRVPKPDDSDFDPVTMLPKPFDFDLAVNIPTDSGEDPVIGEKVKAHRERKTRSPIIKPKGSSVVLQSSPKKRRKRSPGGGGGEAGAAKIMNRARASMILLLKRIRRR